MPADLRTVLSPDADFGRVGGQSSHLAAVLLERQSGHQSLWRPWPRSLVSETNQRACDNRASSRVGVRQESRLGFGSAPHREPLGRISGSEAYRRERQHAR